MAKRTYRALSVKSFDAQKLADRVAGEVLVVGLDIAKRILFAAFMLQDKTRLGIVKWDQLRPAEQADAVTLFKLLVKVAARVELVLEPSGTYGDPWSHLAERLGMHVYRMSPKRVHDFAEVLDGVPSQHDSKSAISLAHLHLDRCSSPWVRRSKSQRELAALVSEADLHQGAATGCLNRLESWAARHWPELHRLLALKSVTILKLLARFSSPQEVALHRAEAGQFMHSVGGPALRESKVSAILESAQTTMGVPPTPAEVTQVRTLAEEILRHKDALKKIRRRAERLSQDVECVTSMRPVLGLMTSVVLYVKLGDPRDYSSPQAYAKAAGLNLTERSSGQYKGLLKLSKRGSSAARRWLYLAVLRLIHQDPVIQAWYLKKVQRDGGRVRMKAIGAVMRKLTKALWHVGHGEIFDPSKLFDSRRLNLRISA